MSVSCVMLWVESCIWREWLKFKLELELVVTISWNGTERNMTLPRSTSLGLDDFCPNYPTHYDNIIHQVYSYHPVLRIYTNEEATNYGHLGKMLTVTWHGNTDSKFWEHKFILVVLIDRS